MKPRLFRTAALVGAAALVLLSVCSSKDNPGAAAGAPTASAPSSSGASAAGSTGTAAGSVPSDARAKVAAKYAGFDDPIYANGDNWLCGAGAATSDRCLAADLDVTVVKPDGTTEITKSTPAADPKFDCFYVYPTINFTEPPGNDDAMAADPRSEEGIVRSQAARFREACRVYAPLYRQNTLLGYGSPDRDKFLAKAYGDVHNAFKYYMAHWNQGRPVLLIGHSQGSGHLEQLLKDEFDNDPALRAQLVSAVLAGGGATLAKGKDTGGSFANLPACRTPDQTGCVVGFNSLAADAPASDLARWGAAPDGQQKLCTNPAALGGGPATIDPIAGNQQGTYSTPWVEYPGALTAECKTTGDATALVIGVSPGETRDVASLVKNQPNWGLHLTEVNLTQRQLVDLARRQAAALPAPR